MLWRFWHILNGARINCWCRGGVLPDWILPLYKNKRRNATKKIKEELQ